jgi:hypothetical protein
MTHEKYRRDVSPVICNVSQNTCGTIHYNRLVICYNRLVIHTTIQKKKKCYSQNTCGTIRRQMEQNNKTGYIVNVR